MVAIDTNVLVRLLLQDDPRQAAAAQAFIEQGAWVPLLALAEAVWVLGSVYDRTARDIADLVEMLLDHRTLTLQSREIVDAALTLFRTKPGLGFSDCVILESARSAGNLPLGTFDRELGRLAGAARLGTSTR